MGCGCGNAINMTGGSPKGKRMETETVDALLVKAKKYNIVGRHDMRKDELIKAIRRAQKEIGAKISKRR